MAQRRRRSSARPGIGVTKPLLGPSCRESAAQDEGTNAPPGRCQNTVPHSLRVCFRAQQGDRPTGLRQGWLRRKANRHAAATAVASHERSRALSRGTQNGPANSDSESAEEHKFDLALKGNAVQIGLETCRNTALGRSRCYGNEPHLTELRSCLDNLWFPTASTSGSGHKRERPDSDPNGSPSNRAPGAESLRRPRFTLTNQPFLR